MSYEAKESFTEALRNLLERYGKPADLGVDTALLTMYIERVLDGLRLLREI